MVPDDRDRSHLDFRAFINVEEELDRVRGRNSLVSRFDRCELAPMLGQQLLDDHFGALDFGGVELTFHAEADFFFLECVQDVRFGDRFVSLVLDAADDRSLGAIKDDDLPVRIPRIVLDLQANVLEELGVPQCLEVAPDGIGAIWVADAREDSPLQSAALNAPQPDEVNAGDDVLLAACFLPLSTRQATREDGKNTHKCACLDCEQKNLPASGHGSAQGRSIPPKISCSPARSGWTRLARVGFLSGPPGLLPQRDETRDPRRRDTPPVLRASAIRLG